MSVSHWRLCTVDISLTNFGSSPYRALRTLDQQPFLLPCRVSVWQSLAAGRGLCAMDERR